MARPLSRATHAYLNTLERQLKCELYQARIARALDSPEIASVREVPVRLEELRVVELVEQFAAKLQFEALADRRHLQESDFPVVDSRPATNRARRVADGAGRHGVLRECAGIKSQISRPARIEFLERRRHIWLPRSLEIEAGLQLDVVLFRNADGEARLERRDSGHRPAVERLALETFVLRNRHFPVIAQNEAVPCIEQREGAVPLGIYRVHQALKRGCVVDGFPVGVCRFKLQSVRETLLQTCLETIVSRVGDGVLREDVRDHRHAIRRATVPAHGITKWRGIRPRANQSNRCTPGRPGYGASGRSFGNWTGNVRTTGRGGRSVR